MQPIRHILPILSVTVLLGACAGTPAEKKYDSMSGMSPSTASASPNYSAAADAAARAAAARNAAAAAPQNDSGFGPVAERTVYFGFDQSSVSSGDADLLTRHARYLSGVPNTRVRVEGHTDERGSTEYNLALGQRRADAVRRALSTLGVRESMIESVSWGEQKPVMQGRGEDSWARNRRAELIY